jgi:hypothetical protein
MKRFFVDILPYIKKDVVLLRHWFPEGIPLLKRGVPFSVSFTRQQLSVIISGAALLVYPGRISQHIHSKTEYASYSTINFNR